MELFALAFHCSPNPDNMESEFDPVLPVKTMFTLESFSMIPPNYDLTGKRVQGLSGSQYLFELRDQKLERVLYINE